MFLTLLFVIIFLSKKENYTIIHEKVDDEPDLFEIENPFSHSHNPAYYDNYWNKIYKELFYFLAKSIVILLCIYLDINCIKYMFIGE
jgi:hypothetical protein